MLVQRYANDSDCAKQFVKIHKKNPAGLFYSFMKGLGEEVARGELAGNCGCITAHVVILLRCDFGKHFADVAQRGHGDAYAKSGDDRGQSRLFPYYDRQPGADIKRSFVRCVILR